MVTSATAAVFLLLLLPPLHIPVGDWIATMDGDKYVSEYITKAALRRALFLVPLACVLLATGVMCCCRCGGGEVGGREGTGTVPGAPRMCPAGSGRHVLLQVCVG